MAANITDKFNQATTTGRPSPAALTAVKTIGATSITVDSTTEWPTDTAVHFIIYEVDANNDRVEGTQCDFKGVVNSATTINNLTLKAGTDREYSIGSKVICAPTAAWADDVVEGLAVSLNQDGTLKDNIVTPDKWSNPYCFAVHKATDQTGLADGTWSQINFDTEHYDPNSNFNTGTYTYTVPVTGLYEFGTFLRANGTGITFTGARIKVNGSTVHWLGVQNTATGTAPVYVTGSIKVLLNAADTVTYEANINVSSGTGTVSSSAYNGESSRWFGSLINET